MSAVGVTFLVLLAAGVQSALWAILAVVAILASAQPAFSQTERRLVVRPAPHKQPPVRTSGQGRRQMLCA